MTVTVTCPVLGVKEQLEAFAAGDMCGRCLPCPTGVLSAISILERLSRGEGRDEDLAELSAIGEHLAELSRCPRGQGAGGWILEALKDEQAFQAHLARRCPAGDCRNLVKYRVNTELCTMCDECRKVCPRDAILGEPYVAWRGDNRPYRIVEELCDGCGRCAEACPERAIELW